ncbi:MAG: hypothetical protein ABW173_00595 [Sphingomonas sp.]
MGWRSRIGRWFAPTDAAGPLPAAFAGLETVSDTTLTLSDRASRWTIRWADVRRITAAMGRQQYDMTICLTVAHRGGKTIFLPETHPDWTAFLAAAERNLAAVAPRAGWEARLRADPEAVVRVYPARG